jgi:predicted DNA binding CopG/RHH family protein
MKKLKQIPQFKNEKQEQEFWLQNDSTDFVDWSSARTTVLPKLKPTTETISLRLPISVLQRLKVEANKRDMPYQSYIKSILGNIKNHP